MVQCSYNRECRGDRWHVPLVLATVLLELPVSVVQWAYLSCLQPPRDAVEMEGVITDTPSHGALFRGRGSLVGLTFDA